MIHSRTARRGLFMLAALVAGLVSGVAGAEDMRIQIKGHAFVPTKITIPASTRVKLLVSNENALPAEFEGQDFPSEKVIPGHTELPVYIGPLDAGTYHFFNEFDPGVTGELIVE
ncbi:cupredoxin domain-containing protein [Salinisphaera aquimarina]|uniref:Cupredoxin domain-containing protein n=1 Tax=Salinisphaera aquimarina TaxID=2094031 RepID=A0ABV7EQ98_9GAMM